MARSPFWKSPQDPGLQHLNELLLWVKARQDAPLLAAKLAGEWRTISAREFYHAVRALASHLRALGLEPGDRVGLISESRPEWMIADFGCLAAGLVDVPIYPTLTAQQIGYMLRDSEARLVFVSSAELRAQVESERAQLPHLRWVVSFEANGGEAVWAELIRPDSLTIAEEAFDERLRRTAPAAPATLLYTSGTTGVPKAVPLTHANLAANLNVTLVDFYFGPQERRLSILPLSHITERHLGYADFMVEAATYFSESMEAIPANLLEVRPTLLVAVPRVFEKVAARTKAEVLAKPKLLQWIFAWAQGVGRKLGPYWLAGWPSFGPRKRERAGGAAAPPWHWRLAAAVAERLVYHKLQDRLGGHLDKILVGGAPLGRELGEYLLSLGVILDQGYGLSETSPVIAVNRPGHRRIGSVGRPVPNVEVRFAEDGELQVRGPSVFGGYAGLPEESAAALRDGWFHTGDIGYQDADGFIYITDRKKDLIKTAGGKFIAPQPIESRLKASSYIAEAVVVGEGRKHAAALLVPNFAALAAAAGVAAAAAATAAGREELCGNASALACIDREVQAVNAELARFETIKRFALLPEEFSIAGGEITPTVKVRRRTVELKYRALIDSLFAE